MMEEHNLDIMPTAFSQQIETSGNLINQIPTATSFSNSRSRINHLSGTLQQDQFVNSSDIGPRNLQPAHDLFLEISKNLDKVFTNLNLNSWLKQFLLKKILILF